MKHLTAFNRLFEGIEDGNEIIRALKETPAGKELQKLLGVGSLNYRGDTIGFEERFHLARTGRVNIGAFGGKTHAERTESGKWMHISKSSGGSYGESYTDTIDELLKSLIITFVIKQRPLGINSTQFKEYLNSNIGTIIANQLDVDGIIEAYSETLSVKTLETADKIAESDQFKIFTKVFNSLIRDIYIDKNRITFTFNLYPIYSLSPEDRIYMEYNITRKKGFKSVPSRGATSLNNYNIGAETVDVIGKYFIDGLVKSLGKYETRGSYIQGLMELRNSIASIKDGNVPSIEDTINVEDFSNNVKEYIENGNEDPKVGRWYSKSDTKTLSLDLAKFDIIPQSVLSLLADAIIDMNDLKLFSLIKEEFPKLNQEIKSKMGDSADLASDLGALGF
jgi:hypothetical protein